MVCSLCGAELSDSEDLQEHFITSCLMSSPGASTRTRLPAQGRAGTSRKPKQVSVVFRWLPYRTLKDQAVHLFGDKSLNKGSPLQLNTTADGGNFSSAQVTVNVGEYVGCQLALEQGDMLPVQSFLVTERSQVVYLFPESTFGLGSTTDASLRQQPVRSSAAAAVLRESSDESEIDDTSGAPAAAAGMMASAATGSFRHPPSVSLTGRRDTNPGQPVARAFGREDLLKQGRERPEGAAEAPRDSTSSLKMPSLYHEMLLHQIGKDESILSHQAMQESQQSHEQSEQVRARKDVKSTPATAPSGVKSRAGQPVRALHQNDPASHIHGLPQAAGSSKPRATDLFTPLGDSRTRASSLGNLRQAGLPSTALPEPQHSLRSHQLPKVSAAPGTSVAPPSVEAGGTAEAIASAIPSLPPRIDGKHTIEINDIRFLPSDAALLAEANTRPSSAPTRRRKPPPTDDDEDFVWRPSGAAAPLVSGSADPGRQPSSSAAASGSPHSIGVFAPGQSQTEAAVSTSSSIQPGSIPFKGPSQQSDHHQSSILPTSLADAVSVVPSTAATARSLTTSIGRASEHQVSRVPSSDAERAHSSVVQPGASIQSSAANEGGSAVSPPSPQPAPLPSRVTAAVRRERSSSESSCSLDICESSRALSDSADQISPKNLAHNELTRSASSLGSILSSLPGLERHQMDLSTSSLSETELEASALSVGAVVGGGDRGRGHTGVHEDDHHAEQAAPVSTSEPLNEIAHSTTVSTSANTSAPVTTTAAAVSGAVSAEPASEPAHATSTSKNLQDRCELLEQNMMRQRAHLESQIRRRDDSIQSLQNQLKEAEETQATVSSLHSEVQRLREALAAAESQRVQAEAQVASMTNEMVQMEADLTTQKKNGARQAQQLLEARAELEKSFQTVQAALQLQEAHQQQAEELELAKADRDILVEQNRELIETTHKQKKEVERVTQRNDRLRQENQQLAQGLDEKKQMEKEIVGLKAQKEKSVAVITRYENEVSLIRLELKKTQEAYQAREMLLTRSLVEVQQQLQTSQDEISQLELKVSQGSSQLVPAPNRTVAEECVKLRTENSALHAEISRVQAEADSQVAKLRQDVADLLRHSRETGSGQMLTDGGERAAYLQLVRENEKLHVKMQSLESTVEKSDAEKSKLTDRMLRYRSERNHYHQKYSELKTQLGALSPQQPGQPTAIEADHLPPTTREVPVGSQEDAVDAAGANQRGHVQPVAREASAHSALRTMAHLPLRPPEALGEPRAVGGSGGVVSPLKSSHAAAPMVATRPTADFVVAGGQAAFGLDEPPSSRPSSSRRSPDMHRGNSATPGSASSRRSRSVPRARSSLTPDSDTHAAHHQHRSPSLDRSLGSSGHFSMHSSPQLDSLPLDHAPVRLRLGDAVMVQRANLENHFGYVRYIGKLKGKEGDFVGVELVEELGRNDGTVRGHRYFKCGPNRGVFAKRDRVELVGS